MFRTTSRYIYLFKLKYIYVRYCFLLQQFQHGVLENLSRRVQGVNVVAQELIQSAASGVDTSALEGDLESLMDKWNALNAKVTNNISHRSCHYNVGGTNGFKFFEYLKSISLYSPKLACEKPLLFLKMHLPLVNTWSLHYCLANGKRCITFRYLREIVIWTTPSYNLENSMMLCET